MRMMMNDDAVGVLGVVPPLDFYQCVIRCEYANATGISRVSPLAFAVTVCNMYVVFRDSTSMQMLPALQEIRSRLEPLCDIT